MACRCARRGRIACYSRPKQLFFMQFLPEMAKTAFQKRLKGFFYIYYSGLIIAILLSFLNISLIFHLKTGFYEFWPLDTPRPAIYHRCK